MLVSVVVPVKDGSPYLRDCLSSLHEQDFGGAWEVSVYDDGSSDDTPRVILEFASKFAEKGIGFKSGRGEVSGGVGFAKNRAAEMCSGEFLCFSDADDVSLPSRLNEMFEFAQNDSANGKLVFLGSQFTRFPEGSTERYTRWANQLADQEVNNQIFTSHGPTLIAPTWFISRKLFDVLGGFNQNHRTGYPEDLDFFYRAHRLGNVVFRKVPHSLVVYRYHSGCASLGVKEASIWEMRIDYLRATVLSRWDTFTIWSAGKQGKRFFKSLLPSEKCRVAEFCDVDEKKIRRGVFEEFDEAARKVTHRIPIVHVKNALPPLIVCVKLDMTGGDLERLLAESGWVESRDYVLFS